MVVDYSSPSCQTQTMHDIAGAINSQISTIIFDYAAKLRNIYYKQCVTSLTDVFTASYNLKYHHYTLYYYDRAGNLVKTVPPAGVNVTSTNRLTDHPDHAMITEYEYNSLGQLVRQKTPDGGQSFFLYDAKGKLRFSQNAKQAATNPTLTVPRYSYTKYDELTRIIEVGEFAQASPPNDAQANTPSSPASGGLDITKTVYSTPAIGVTYFGGKTQRYLQNRVSYSLSDKDGVLATLNDQVVTYYSYDPHGNVEWIIQDVPEIGRNYVAYEYDLISGSVVKVRYNEEFSDKFFHRYAYDVDKRIKTVETSVDGIFWEKDATYNYYLHGPLKRALIGHDKIQGLDYAYTINGWLKSLNGASPTSDPGGDGSLTDNNMYVARDAYSMVLGYFNNDFKNKSSLLNSENGYNLSGTNLYNGNISSWTNTYDKNAMSAAMISSVDYNANNVGRTFRYDELNRITNATYYTKPVNSDWFSVNDYKETFSYDANGNIINLFRNGNAANLSMDNLSYSYYKQDGTIYTPNLMAPAPSNIITNKLAYVTDAVTSAYTDDIDTQTNPNYTYDEIGNLKTDVAEGITAINWNVYGKISDITKTKSGITTVMSFLYDASGNRVYKKVSNPASPTLGDVTTYYIKDASGNSMGVYERTNTGTSPNFTANFTLKEQTLYGSDRLGIRNKSITRTTTFVSPATPTVQLSPTLVHTSSYPFIMLPLANNTSRQVFCRDINTQSNTTLLLGTNEYVNIAPVSPVTTYSQSSSMHAMAYDLAGNLLLSAYNYSVFVTGVYNSNKTMLYSKDAFGTDISVINASSNAQAAFLKKPGTTDQYYFFTIGTNGKPYFHTIDANMGTLVDYNNEIDANTDYGNTMALFEDKTGTGNSTLYLRRYNTATSTSSVALFSITEAGIQTLPTVSIGTAVNTSSIGEMAISPSGTLLAVVSNSTASIGKISLLTISSNHQTLTSTVTRTFTGTAKSIEFSKNDLALFFTSRVSTTTNLLRLPIATLASAAPVNMHAQTLTNTQGSIRKGNNNFIYYLTNATAAPTTQIVRMFLNPEASYTSTSITLTNTFANGSLPIQPHLLAYTTPATSVVVYNRELNKKEYELKDHLGNIHTTVADYKIPFPFGKTSDVVTDQRFDAANTTPFTLMAGAPASSAISNVNNSLRVLSGASTGATAQANFAGVGAGQYVISFDYSTPIANLNAYCSVANAANGATNFFMSQNSRLDFVVNMPAGATTIDLRFTTFGTGSNVDFYIDNLLIKKIAEPNVQSISTIVNEDYSTPSNWVGTNTLINYSAGTLNISRDPAYTSSTFTAKKTLNLLQDQLYRITFSTSALTMSGAGLSFAIDNSDFTEQTIEQYSGMSNTAATNYTFYVVPRTNNNNLLFSISGVSSYFTFDVDNFKVENVTNPINVLYTSVMNNLTDYYAFGSPMPGRKFNSNTYKYGFNGQEKDDEIKGSGNSINYSLRMHDPRLGRFLSIDPLVKHFAGNSPYAFCQNRVIDGRELEGAEYVHYYVFLDIDGKTLIQNVKVEDFRGMSSEQLQRTHGMGSSEFYKKYSESFGKEGRGVKYTYFIKDSRNGSFNISGTSFEKSGETFSHGLYYGAGGTSQQGDRSSVPAGTKGNKYTYDEKPIDEVDALARAHDMAYDKAGASDFYSDPKGIIADLNFINGLKAYVQNATKEGYTDAITGKVPSKEAIVSANRAIKAFSTLLGNKLDNLIKDKSSTEVKK